MLRVPKIIEDIIQIKNDLSNLMSVKSEMISPINGWELTRNNIGKITKFGVGLSVLEVELKAMTEVIANSIAFRIPKEFTPNEKYMIFTFSKSGSMGSGYIYNDGRVVLNGSFTSGTIVAIKVLIVNRG